MRVGSYRNRPLAAASSSTASKGLFLEFLFPADVTEASSFLGHSCSPWTAVFGTRKGGANVANFFMDASTCKNRVSSAANCAVKNRSLQPRDCRLATRDDVICVGSVPALCRPVNHTDQKTIMCLFQWLMRDMWRVVDNKSRKTLVG